MYVVTFYSYKGGVGRTMALVNAAAVLAQRGRKVLIVDFDLEAPGISTYKPFACLTDTKGVVEYVSEYIETSVAPEAKEFIVDSKLGDAKIWAMPAGKRSREYSKQLASIDWHSLYTNHNGYLFFEDLKQQWKSLGFDYVLIDSRTGHTDVGGICTRQLPNAVVIMFFPNDQNLVGLESTVKDIREEANLTKRDKIAMHFCASNVPDLDDEDHILERKLEEARRFFGYQDSPSIIHHYNSLTLLEQSLFVLDRPESKLTTEYKSLVNLIVTQNLEDREGALFELRRMRDEIRQKGRTRNYVSSISKKLEDIARLHPRDGQIAWLMAHVYGSIGDLNEETRRLSVAIEADVNALTARRRRAAIARLESRSEDAITDLYAILLDARSASFEFVAAVELLREFDPAWVSVVANSPTLSALEDEEVVRLADILLSDPKGTGMVVSLMQNIVATSEDAANRRRAKSRLILALINSRQFERAMKQIASRREEALESHEVTDVFNYAMSEWGRLGVPSLDLMQRVVALMDDSDYRSANRHQCLAVAYYVCGNTHAAKAELERARAVNSISRGREFSCWRYLELSRSEMNRDLDALEQFINKRGPGPAVFARTEGADELLLN